MKKYVNIILGICLVAYYIVVNIISSRKIAFSEAFLFLGVVIIIFHFLKINFRNNVAYKKVIKIGKILICIGMICFCILEALIITYPKKSKNNLEYIMVLGAGLNNGYELSQTLKDRLDATLECINTYNNDGYIVVSGGQGDDEDISEAEAMKNYLVKNGIDLNKIIKEDKSTNTYENFKYSKEKIEEHSNKKIEESSVKFITTDFHAFRSSILAKRNGYVKLESYTSNTVSYLIPTFYTREALALVKSFLFDR